MGILGGKKAAEPESAPPAPAGLSVIAVGMTVRGNLDSNGTVKIEGTVEGDVHTRAQALVAKGGAVHGDLSADEIVVGGTVTGAVRARGRVEIQTGAVVDGDVTTRRILVAEGATLNGLVRMGDAAFDDVPSYDGFTGR
jgi:cytoskeletal protein CcmA (bactofilin family)